ncbi:MAG: ornithine cyclodeaminase family protein [Magnetospiraceae bacterium]
MRIVTAGQIRQVLDYPSLVDRIQDYFRSGCTVPTRHHHCFSGPEGHDATLLLMPAWREGGYIGVKVASVFPDNGAKDLPAVMATYLLLSGKTGEPLALMDGQELTARRTAAASALAARFLARQDSARLLMIGTGRLAPQLILAHAAVRPIDQVLVWGRTPKKADAIAKNMRLPGVSIAATTDLEGAVRGADIISCATLATTPILDGRWLRPGQHVDLVGGFRPDMREADDEVMRRSALFVDTRAGALAEAGDLVDPIARGLLSETDIRGDLFDLCRGDAAGRSVYNQITLFKSVGTALEDLAGAKLAFERT